MKVYKESRVHKTPAGGVRSEAIYMDDHLNPVEKEKATRIMIHEYDAEGNIIFETLGFTKRKKN